MLSDQALDAACAVGRKAWPTVSVDREQFARHVSAKADDVAERDRERLDFAGLYLAAAVLAGDPEAVRTIVLMLPVIDSAIRRLGADATRIEDVRQQVLDIVVVGGERGPAIAGYTGRSDVRSWLRSVAVRTALKMWRERRAGSLEDDDLIGLADDPEIAHLKVVYAEHVTAAAREALEALSPRARTLLRLHHLDGLSVDDLGRMYQVHRATAARWVAAAREAVFEETRLRLEERLGLGEDSAVSIVRLVQSELELSMHRLLASQP